uniref:DNA mismatch repair proteins mutS family domain-containing protein n=1 Tax=Timema tahoe TaxID=61484 RepID=A0A7R9IEE8_9NEOP|nr:unnamed protein product [Timema tahoe]
MSHVNPLLCTEEGLAAYILCITEGQGSILDTLTIGMAAFDPSTGEMIYDMFEDGANRNELERRLEHLNPTEVIVAENVSANTLKLLQHRFIFIRRQPNEIFDFTSCLVKVAAFFSSEGTISSANFQNLGDFAPTTLCCIGVLLHYVKECGLESSLKAEGLLHHWISQPLRNLVKVRQRQDMVEELIGSESGLMEELLNVLEGLPDLERGLTTILNLKCKPLGFYVVVTSLGNVCSKLQSLLNSDTERQSDHTRQLIMETVQLLSNVGLFANNLDKEAVRKEDKANLLIDKSEFPTLVNRQMKVSSLFSQLEALKPSIAIVIGSERFEYTSVGGHDFLIEVKITLPVPSTWRLVSQTKQFNRFRSPAVDALVTELIQLQEILVCDGEEVWLHTLEHFNNFYFPHKRAVKNLATLDVLQSLSELSRQNEYCKLVYRAVLSSSLVGLQSSEQCCMTVSGPNMGGKSCYLRQVALIVIMAHIGSFVPAKSATISLLDAVYVRMGARDELFTGRSTLLLELEEAQVILNCATQHSLVLMDELGRGTSSCDGAAIATATLHHLVKCLTLFVSHYPSVTQLTKLLFPSARNYHVAFMVKPEDDDDGKAVTLLYSVVEGLANESFGLNVARLANIRTDVLSRASHYTDILQSQPESTSILSIILITCLYYLTLASSTLMYAYTFPDNFIPNPVSPDDS